MSNNINKISLANDLRNDLNQSWSGVITLKKLSFTTSFYLLAGSNNVSELILPANSSLHISQRLRLDSSKLEDIEKRLSEANFPLSDNQIHTNENCQYSIFFELFSFI